jgi:hypothetical protein
MRHCSSLRNFGISVFSCTNVTERTRYNAVDAHMLGHRGVRKRIDVNRADMVHALKIVSPNGDDIDYTSDLYGHCPHISDHSGHIWSQLDFFSVATVPVTAATGVM